MLLQFEEGWTSLISDFHAVNPLVTIPQSHLSITKLTSPSNNYAEVRLKVPERLRSEVSYAEFKVL